MELHASQINNGISLIKLTGKLDAAGVSEIEQKLMNYCSGENVQMVVDMSGVDFIASIGIRLLTVSAKSLSKRRGKMVLLNPTVEVQLVLEKGGVPAVIPIYSHLESAETVLLAKA
jgi:anti-anti-sigma factor